MSGLLEESELFNIQIFLEINIKIISISLIELTE